MASIIYLDGEPWGIQGIARDISQRKRAETALRKAYDKEKELGALRSNFMSMVSHDFRIPLSVIQSSSDLLKRYQDRMTEEQQQRHWDKIQSQVVRLADMLTSVLTLSKATDKALRVWPVLINWETFGRTLADEVQLSTDSANRIVYQYHGSHPDGYAGEQLLHRAIANLLSNAIKYSQHDGAIYFDIETSAAAVIFRVKDEGIGIADQDKDRLFDTFFRAGNVGNVPGSGLGLAIVRQAVTAHGGTINVDSRLGAGSIFTVTIPRHLPETS
jgi:signal transduction histidine kinase